MQVAPQNMWGSDFSKFSETPGLVKHVPGISYKVFLNGVIGAPINGLIWASGGLFHPYKKRVMGKPPFPMGKTLEFYTEKHMDVAAEVDAFNGLTCP